MIRRVLAVLGTAVGVLLLLVQPAPAQAPDAQGWWWVAGSPLGVAPPYVPPDGLYVASNPSGPEAVSALRFAVAGGGGADTLALQVEGEVRGTPVVGLCQLTEAWEPAQGGPIADAPACVPDGPAVAGTLAEGVVTFPVSSLVRDGRLDIGIVPGRDASGAAPTFQLVFARPREDALRAASGDGGSAPADAPPPTPDAPGVGDGTFTPVPVADTTVSPPFQPLPPDAPLTGGAPVPAVPSGGTGLSPMVGTVGDDDSDDDAGPWRIVGFVVLGGTALAYHRLSITPDRQPRSLVAFGHHAAEEPT